MAIRIAGTGCFIPERILTNQDLEKMVDTNDEWITTRTGIKQRHIAPKEMPNSDMALDAARKAIANAGIQPDDLDFIISSPPLPASCRANWDYPNIVPVLMWRLPVPVSFIRWISGQICSADIKITNTVW